MFCKTLEKNVNVESVLTCVCVLRRSICEIFMQVKFDFTAVAINGKYLFHSIYFIYFSHSEFKIICVYCYREPSNVSPSCQTKANRRTMWAKLTIYSFVIHPKYKLLCQFVMKTNLRCVNSIISHNTKPFLIKGFNQLIKVHSEEKNRQQLFSISFTVQSIPGYALLGSANP